jgi:hypothetical protein
MYPEPRPDFDNSFSWWAAHIMNKCHIGGIRFGSKWYDDPWKLPPYDTMINRVIPSDPDLMMLFCESKLRVEVFILALFNKYSAIQHLAEKEVGE